MITRHSFLQWQFFKYLCILFFIMIPTFTNSSLSAQEGSSELAFRNQIEAEKIQLKDSEKSENTGEQILLLKSIGAGFQRIGDMDSAIHYYSRGVDLANTEDYPELYSSLVYNLGLVHLSKGEYQKALDLALLALETDRKLNISENIAASLNSVALIYQEWGIYDKSLAYRLESIQFSEASDNHVEIANSQYNLGNLYLKTGKPDKALEYFRLAGDKFVVLLEVNPEDVNLRQALSETVYSIGGIYLYKQDYEKALESFNKALQSKMSLSDKIGIGNCYYQIGLSHILQQEYEEARQNLFVALQYKNMVDDKKGIALVYFRIGEVNFRQSKHAVAETFLQKSISTALEIGDKEILREDYKLLYRIYNAKNNYRQALNYHQLFKAYTDSILNENTSKVVEEMSVRYETEKKEKENEILVRDNEIKELTITRQKSMGMYLIAVIIFVLSIGIILYILYRSKQKTNRIISQKNVLLGEQNSQIADQKKVIEAKNLDLTDSIVYAKRIQDSMLEDVQHLNDILDDAFIYFKPKDIVSGDFYWFGQKGDKFIISAIDCTGHGVPGALMSMLGNSFLNQIIHNQGITSPELILAALSQEVQSGLKQSETNNQDGMDMALCTIDLKTKVVEYAGAKNPLIYIQDGVAERIRADRLPIGISYAEDETFHKHRIEAKSSGCFYMFSDGYPDQFGGEKGSKFMTKRLQNLLLEIHKESMSEQKKILETTMDEWMKNEEQIDDIIIVGFKMA